MLYLLEQIPEEIEETEDSRKGCLTCLLVLVFVLFLAMLCLIIYFIIAQSSEGLEDNGEGEPNNSTEESQDPGRSFKKTPRRAPFPGVNDIFPPLDGKATNDGRMNMFWVSSTVTLSNKNPRPRSRLRPVDFYFPSLKVPGKAGRPMRRNASTNTVTESTFKIDLNNTSKEKYNEKSRNGRNKHDISTKNATLGYYSTTVSHKEEEIIKHTKLILIPTTKQLPTTIKEGEGNNSTVNVLKFTTTWQIIKSTVPEPEEFIVEELAEFSEAASKCEQRDGRFLVVENIDDEKHILQWLKTTDSTSRCQTMFIGVKRIRNQWKTYTGSTYYSSYDFGKSEPPDFYERDNCIIYTSKDSKVKHVPCTSGAGCFVCEIDCENPPCLVTDMAPWQNFNFPKANSLCKRFASGRLAIILDGHVTEPFKNIGFPCSLKTVMATAIYTGNYETYDGNPAYDLMYRNVKRLTDACLIYDRAHPNEWVGAPCDFQACVVCRNNN